MNQLTEYQIQGLKHLGFLKPNGSLEKGFYKRDLEIILEINILLKIFKKENKMFVFQNLESEMKKVEFDLHDENANKIIEY